jgi:copper transport protein
VEAIALKLRAFTVAAAATAAAAAALPTAAWAHATLVRTEPPAQGVVARAPARIVLHFDEEVAPAKERTDVLAADGTSVAAGAPHLAAKDVRAVVIPLQRGLGKGDYTIRWGVVSDDGHVLTGAYAIGVGQGRPPPRVFAGAAGSRSTVDSGFLVPRFLYFAGLFILVGGVLFRLLVVFPALRLVGREEGAEARDIETLTAAVLVFIATMLVLVAGAAAVIRQGTQAAGISFWAPLQGRAAIAGAAGSTRFGEEFGRGLEAAVAFPLLLVVAHFLRRWRPLQLVAGAAAAVAAAWALLGAPLSGHAGDPGRGVLTIAVDGLHVAGTAAWIGGLAYLFLVVPFATGALPDAARGRVRLEIAQRTSKLALASVCVVAATGVGRALWELGAVSQLWTTAYGRMLLIKSGLLAVAVTFGYLNRRRLADFAGLRRRVGVELAVLVTLIAAVSLLTDLPPAKKSGRNTPPPAAAKP